MRGKKTTWEKYFQIACLNEEAPRLAVSFNYAVPACVFSSQKSDWDLLGMIDGGDH